MKDRAGVQVIKIKRSVVNRERKKKRERWRDTDRDSNERKR